MKKPKNISEVMAYLGSKTSEKKKKSSRKNWEKARIAIAKKRRQKKKLDKDSNP